jgi:hypothetical protein
MEPIPRYIALVHYLGDGHYCSVVASLGNAHHFLEVAGPVASHLGVLMAAVGPYSLYFVACRQAPFGRQDIIMPGDRRRVPE